MLPSTFLKAPTGVVAAQQWAAGLASVGRLRLHQRPVVRKEHALCVAAWADDKQQKGDTADTRTPF